MKNTYIGIIIAIVIVIISITKTSSEDLCHDYILLDGSEPILKFGFDTTHNWWAYTQPFNGKMRVIVNGQSSKVYVQVQNMTFSADGEKWAYFAEDETQWYLVKNDTTITLPAYSTPGFMKFTTNSQDLFYSYYENGQAYLISSNKNVSVLNYGGRFYSSYGGEKLAYTGKFGSQYNLNIDNYVTQSYDSIVPIGFLYDGTFLFAGKSGDLWQIYRKDNSLTEPFLSLLQYSINNEGTVAAVLITLTNGKSQSVLFSDEYTEPLIGRLYDQTARLVLHPSLPLIAYSAISDQNSYVVMNNTEYYTAPGYVKPKFTFDGSEVFYVSCDAACYVGINGKSYKINDILDPMAGYAMKPGSNTIAYSTNSSMIVRFLDIQDLHAGMMVDSIISPRYNWRDSRYEALGTINNRLYLLTCQLP